MPTHNTPGNEQVHVNLGAHLLLQGSALLADEELCDLSMGRKKTGRNGLVGVVMVIER